MPMRLWGKCMHLLMQILIINSMTIDVYIIYSARDNHNITSLAEVDLPIPPLEQWTGVLMDWYAFPRTLCSCKCARYRISRMHL